MYFNHVTRRLYKFRRGAVAVEAGSVGLPAQRRRKRQVKEEGEPREKEGRGA